MATTNKDDSYGPEFLYSEDLLKGGEYLAPEVEISEVHPPGTVKCQKGRKTIEDKWTIGFKGAKKMLVLCKTNKTVIHTVTGEEPGPNWIGKKITLEVRIIDSFSKKEPAIRVIPPAGTMLRRKTIEMLGTKAVFNG